MYFYEEIYCYTMRKCLLLFFLMLVPFLHLGAQDELTNGLNNLLNDKMFRSSDVSVAVYDLTDDKMLFEHRAHKMVRPASVMKVITAVTALEYLGADYQIETDLYRLSKDSVNNVYVKGAMDPLFDMEDPAYLRAGLEAIDALTGKIPFFEVNTGAISRGYRTAPYPAPAFLRAFRERGFGAVITSDCHNAQFLDCGFADAVQLLRSCGFKERYILTKDGFKPIPLDE